MQNIPPGVYYLPRPPISNTNEHERDALEQHQALSLGTVVDVCHHCGGRGYVSRLVALPRNVNVVNAANLRSHEAHPLASRENTQRESNIGPHHESYVGPNMENYDVQMGGTTGPHTRELERSPAPSRRPVELMEVEPSGTIIAPKPHHWHETVPDNSANPTPEPGFPVSDLRSRGRDTTERELDIGLGNNPRWKPRMGNFVVERRETSVAPRTRELRNTPDQFVRGAAPRMAVSSGPSDYRIDYRSPTRSPSMDGWMAVAPSQTLTPPEFRSIPRPRPVPAPSSRLQHEGPRVPTMTSHNVVHLTPDSYLPYGTLVGLAPEEPAHWANKQDGADENEIALAPDPVEKISRARTRAVVRSQAILDKYMPGGVCSLCPGKKSSFGSRTNGLLEHLISTHFVEVVAGLSKYDPELLDKLAEKRHHFIKNEEQYMYIHEYIKALRCLLCHWNTTLLFTDKQLHNHMRTVHDVWKDADVEQETERLKKLAPQATGFYSLQDKFVYNFPFADKGKGKEKEVGNIPGPSSVE